MGKKKVKMAQGNNILPLKSMYCSSCRTRTLHAKKKNKDGTFYWQCRQCGR